MEGSNSAADVIDSQPDGQDQPLGEEQAPASKPGSDDNLEVLPPAPDEELSLLEPGADAPETEGRTRPRTANREIVPYDPLQAYLREIRAYPPLSKEEEHELALRYHHHKDVEAAYRLVTSNLWLVVKISRDYEKAARSILDLIQEGNIGLMEAVKNFDPYRGVRFPSYAIWWIKAYIVRYIIANWRLVKIGTTQAQRKLFFNLKKEKDKLEREGFYPAPRLLAEKLNVKESEVIDMEQRLSAADVSVDSPVQPDSETNLLSVLPAQDLSAEELLSKKQLQEQLAQSLTDFATTLNRNELVIFKERMLGEEKATLQEIAQKVSLSRERIRQIENQIRNKLKAFLVSKFGPVVEHMEF